IFNALPTTQPRPQGGGSDKSIVEFGIVYFSALHQFIFDVRHFTHYYQMFRLIFEEERFNQKAFCKRSTLKSGNACTKPNKWDTTQNAYKLDLEQIQDEDCQQMTLRDDFEQQQDQIEKIVLISQEEVVDSDGQLNERQRIVHSFDEEDGDELAYLSKEKEDKIREQGTGIDNVLLVEGFQVKLADFGLARQLQVDKEYTTNHGGTFLYQGLELLRIKKKEYEIHSKSEGVSAEELIQCIINIPLDPSKKIADQKILGIPEVAATLAKK
ncbi:MAG: hypothetical protein EZS28_031749, partial [Streblomastix strix]